MTPEQQATEATYNDNPELYDNIVNDHNLIGWERIKKEEKRIKEELK